MHTQIKAATERMASAARPAVTPAGDGGTAKRDGAGERTVATATVGAANSSTPDEAAVRTADPRERPAQWNALLDHNYYAYASYAPLAGRWMGALFARRDIVRGTKIAEYRGPLMTDAQVEAEPADGNQYMFAARTVGDLETWVTVDGTPRRRGDNLAGYANYAQGGAANAAPSDEAHAPPRGHTGRTNIVIRATRKITRGTEIRMDYDLGDAERPYQERRRRRL
jgi:hypothetical protein